MLADKAVLVAQADTEIAWRLAAARAQGSIVEAGAESDAFLVEVRKWLVRSKWCVPGGGARHSCRGCNRTCSSLQPYDPGCNCG